MQTAFCVFSAIVLTLAFTVLHGNNLTMQLPGQPHGNFVGKFSGPVESAGLPSSPGLRQKEFK